MATITFPSITITMGPSGAITTAPVANLQSPALPGTVVCNCTVANPTWQGAVTLTGTPADIVVGAITPGAFTLVVGSTPLSAGTYSGGTITTTP